jgi:hypothetical protein
LNAIDALRTQHKVAHDFLEGTIGDVTAAQADWTPPGVANRLAATYAHIVCGEDALVNAIVRQSAPLMATTWAGKTGVSEPPPPGLAWADWGKRVVVDLGAMREYARAVRQSTDSYVASLSEGDLDRKLDLSAVNLGEQTLGWMLALIFANAMWHTGEIACLKGLQGAKGYPV